MARPRGPLQRKPSLCGAPLQAPRRDLGRLRSAQAPARGPARREPCPGASALLPGQNHLPECPLSVAAAFAASVLALLVSVTQVSPGLEVVPVLVFMSAHGRSALFGPSWAAWFLPSCSMCAGRFVGQTHRVLAPAGGSAPRGRSRQERRAAVLGPPSGFPRPPLLVCIRRFHSPHKRPVTRAEVWTY